MTVRERLGTVVAILVIWVLVLTMLFLYHGLTGQDITPDGHDDPTPTLAVIVVTSDPTRPAPSPLPHTPLPPEPVLTTPTSTRALPTVTPGPTSTPVPPTETPGRTPVQKG